MATKPLQVVSWWEARTRMVTEIWPGWELDQTGADDAMTNALRHLGQYCGGKVIDPTDLLGLRSRYSDEPRLPTLQEVLTDLKRVRYFFSPTPSVDYEATEWRGDLIAGGPRPLTITKTVLIRGPKISWARFRDHLIQRELLPNGLQPKFKKPKKSRTTKRGTLVEKERKFVNFMKTAKKTLGRYPPRDPPTHTRWPGKTISEWARENDVPRPKAEKWATAHGLKEQRGAPKRNSAENNLAAKLPN